MSAVSRHQGAKQTLRDQIIRLPSGLADVALPEPAKATSYTNGPAEV